MVSLEKEKKKESFTSQLTGTQSESVNKRDSVNNLLTNLRFKSELQRLRRDQLIKVSDIALKHGRRSFAEVLDLLLHCYDYLDGIREKYNLPGLASTMEYIDESLPGSEADVIAREVVSLLERLNLNDPTLEKVLVSILFNVKLKNKKPSDILRPLLVTWQDGR